MFVPLMRSSNFIPSKGITLEIMHDVQSSTVEGVCNRTMTLVLSGKLGMPALRPDIVSEQTGAPVWTRIRTP